MRPLPYLAVAVGLAAVLGACGGPAGSNAPLPTAEGVVNVDASEYRFAPATISVPAGAVTFRVRNVGVVDHEFEVFKGEAAVGKIGGLTAGLVQDLAVTLEAGEYAYVCKLAGHDAAGMKGTLTVTGG